MSESTTRDEVNPRVPAKPQTGAQIWVNCLLFIGIPTLLILVIKYFFRV